MSAVTHPVNTAAASADDDALAASAPLDALLVDATVGSVARFLPGAETVALTKALATRPLTVAQRVAGLGGELLRVARGTSTVEPSPKDRRYADAAWRDNPVLHRLVQAHLAAGSAAGSLVEESGLEGKDAVRMKFLVDNLVDATAPSNNPLVNPAAIKELLETGGASALRGLGNLARDLSSAPRVPAMVDTEAFTVGEDLGVSKGSVVLRTPVFELIQYAPTTAKVRAVPLLIVPPTINKFYVLDLAPGRSLVEHIVASGQQVFMVSWRNPSAEHADWGLDTYITAVVDALDAVREIAGTDTAHLLGTCSGGIISSMAAAYLSGQGRHDELAGLTLLVTVLDQASAGLASALMDEGRAKAATARSARDGYLDGRNLAEVFAWLRPNDLVWNYWVNNYLLGKKPPAFDVLYWNADTTRMSAALHRDFIDIALGNRLVTPNDATALGAPVDLSSVKADAYVVAGVADHITPWQNCYQTTQLLGGSSRFVLSTSGHIAALVNPPSNPKARHQASTQTPADAEEFVATTPMSQGSWWSDYTEWLSTRSGAKVAAPTELGAPGLEPIAAAPGTYVLES